MNARFAVAMAAVCLLPSLAWSQGYEDIRRLRELQRRQQLQNIPRENLEASGVLKGIRGPLLHITTDGGEQWLVQVQPARPQDVSFSGTADATFLKPGMLVQFTAQLSKRGQAEQPVGALQVFTPREGYQVGVVASNAGGGGVDGDLFGVRDEEPAKPKAKLGDDTEYRVSGQITKISRTGELTINAGGTTVKADLADDAKVAIEVANLSYVRPGDKVEVRGWYIMGAKGQAVGTNVAVTAAEPLSSGKKKPAKTADDNAEDKSDDDAEKADSEA